MRAHRRLAMIRRVVPYLAAGVGLFSLLATLLADMDHRQAVEALATSVAATRAGLEDLGSRVASESKAQQGTDSAAALAALGTRLAALEEHVKSIAETAATAPPPGASQGTADGAEAPVDASLPMTDCIPLGTRFMATPDTEYPLCQSRLVLKVGAITGDAVSIGGAGEVLENGFAKVGASGCTVTVFSADSEGFAELRVSCT